MQTNKTQPLDPEPGNGWEALFRDVFKRSLNPIILLDESRRVLEANPAAIEMLGYSPEQWVGRSIDELIMSPSPTQRDRDWQGLLQTGEQSGTDTLRRSDGVEIEIDFAIRLVRLGQRTLGVAVVLPRDRVTLAREVGGEIAPLTGREREVVALVALGLDTNHMAERLVVSTETVRAHVKNAMVKLGVHNRARLVAVAISRGELLQAGRGEDFTGP